MTRALLACSTAFALAFGASNAFALDSDANKPINIAADKLQIDDRAGTAIYTGQVHMEQGTMKLDADRVEITRGNAGGVSKVNAKGNRAYIEQLPAPDDATVKGWGNTIIYHADTRRVELIGNAELHQAQDTFTGGYVEYYLDRRQVNARSSESQSGQSQNGRVRMTLTPNSQGSDSQ
ncbi:lipopolysaccharide transport periplasmic protein LptA [Phytohalomonas tamaricis]|uniref:lipopolysaccharide transport periplasmic protein LptA n=1 Tax=Phytohalomonas tamaricis TaxID=2081032 RepID=UPI000D0ADB11|nr:lipopolysaccharide transport periplasmic protein LptA [Phytohalomonas tamaricis]